MSQHPAIEAGRTAVITGGASGIGLAAAKKLAGLGMNIVIADFNDETLQAAHARPGRGAARRSRRCAPTSPAPRTWPRSGTGRSRASATLRF